MDVENKNEWEDCLDVGGVKLPTGLYFGTTAATGQLAGIYWQLHFIIDKANLGENVFCWTAMNLEFFFTYNATWISSVYLGSRLSHIERLFNSVLVASGRYLPNCEVDSQTAG